MKCPKCGYENADDALSCGMCTEVFKKETGSTPDNQLHTETELALTDPAKKIPFDILIFLLGLILYPLIHSIYFLDLMCCYFTVLVHELGHCIMFLIFGQFALPKLDFVYGGGMALPIFTSGKIGLIIITALLIFLTYSSRQNTRLMIFLISITVLYPILAFTKGQEVLIGAAGHLCEVVAAGICFYRCLIARNVQTFERPIYAVLGWWISIYGIGFFWRVATDMSARLAYIHGPGYSQGVKINDLVGISNIVHWDVGTIATIFSLLYILPILWGVCLAIWKTVVKYK